MKLQFELFITLIAAWMVIATGCSGNKKSSADVTRNTNMETLTGADIQGQWYIENIIFNDSDCVRPEEVMPGVQQYISFEDSTYFIQTNCNTISGFYTIKGDSITLGDGAMTEMACDNMATEDALRRILTDISTIEVRNDSVVVLNGAAPGECILLRKAIKRKSS